jgi:hypothetical protein
MDKDAFESMKPFFFLSALDSDLPSTAQGRKKTITAHGAFTGKMIIWPRPTAITPTEGG